MTLVASLLLSVVPQVLPGGDIQLPPAKPRPAAEQPSQRNPSDLERLRRDLIDLRATPERVEQRLRQMAQDYAAPALEGLMVEVARSARSDELEGLMVAARRFCTGSRVFGDELLFQLLSRPLGEATRSVLQTMVVLKGADAKVALQECVRSRVTGVRRQATELLAPMLAPTDWPFVSQLSREQALDLQLRAVELLAVLPDDRAQDRLLELLAKDPALAGAAAVGLVRIGRQAVPALQRQFAAPPVDRAFAYAGFVLAQLAPGLGPDTLPASGAETLAQRLRDPEALTRCLVAIPLADLVYRGIQVAGESVEVGVIEALLDVVAPVQFVPNLDLLRRPAEERLLLLTGRPAASSDPRTWRDWWKLQRDAFVGVRADIVVDDANIGGVVLSWRHDDRHVRLLAEGLADAAPMPNATEIVLGHGQLLQVLASLRAAGFLDPARMRIENNLPRVRSLQLEVLRQRCLMLAPVADAPVFDALTAIVQGVVADEAWQLYRSADEPRGAHWRTEAAWRAAHPEALVRGQRLAQRIVRSWSGLGPELRTRAIDFLVSHPQRSQLLGEADGEVAVATLAGGPPLQDLDLRLLELAAAVPGEKVWRAALQAAVTAKGGGRGAVRAVFAVLGTDAVLASLGDANPVVRRAGIEEAVTVRDDRAAPRLVELLQDADVEVQRTAVYACGALRVPAASRPLVALIAAEQTAPTLRREALVALGRVGGDLAFPVLQRAMTAPDPEDRDATLRALGELSDPRAANLLAELAVVGNGKDLGNLATASLLRHGAKSAVPALRAQLDVVKDSAIREQLVLALGSYQDPAVIPDLLDLLRLPRHAASAASLLSCTTGMPLVESPQSGSRIDQAEAWYRQNKAKPQWQWLLDALQRARVTTSLHADEFTNQTKPETVVELARLLVEAPEARLWPLCCAVLRSTTGEDYGTVTLHSAQAAREAIAERYRLSATTPRTAAK